MHKTLLQKTQLKRVIDLPDILKTYVNKQMFCAINDMVISKFWQDILLWISLFLTDYALLAVCVPAVCDTEQVYLSNIG